MDVGSRADPAGASVVRMCGASPANRWLHRARGRPALALDVTIPPRETVRTVPPSRAPRTAVARPTRTDRPARLADFGPDAPFLGIDPAEHGITTPLADDVRLLDRLLGRVLRDTGDGQVIALARALFDFSRRPDHESAPAAGPDSLFDHFPALRDPAVASKVLRAFTVLFQVVNVAEQKEIVRANRERQAVTTGTPRPESIDEAVGKLAAAGVPAESMQVLLDRIEVCPTITAHPTEARRRSVMDKLLDIAEALSQRAAPPANPRLDLPLDTVALPERHIVRRLTALWNTDELRAGKVTVRDEVQNAVYFFQRTILDVVTWLHGDLREALGRYYPGHDFHVPPFLRYHSWVGGDRDGNPNVTPEITWWTLLEHKRTMLQHYEARVAQLRRKMSVSERLAPISGALAESLERDAATIEVPADLKDAFPAEPYARKLTFVLERLKATRRHLDALTDFRAEAPDFVAQPPAYVSADDFLADLVVMSESLKASPAGLLADEGSLPRLITQVRTFGLRLASLDVRQHSKDHAAALDEVFAVAGVTTAGAPYSGLPEDDKVRLLTRELRGARPLVPRGWTGTPATTRALDVLTVVRHARRYISSDAVTCYVISMTHEVSDVLEVLVLAKEEGLVRWIDGPDGVRHLESDIDIVPLFETIEDLQGCDTLLRKLFAEPTYRLHLKARNEYQEIMLGYSDSSKDGGYLAANWNLQDTQSRLAAACRRAGLDFRFFHGRGGTVGRGGGRASRAILSQPAGSFTGRIRFTEQGEVVSFRYSLRPMAHRHLEQIVNSVLVAAAADLGLMPAAAAVAKSRKSEAAAPSPAPADTRAEPPAFRRAMAVMAARSREVYRALVYDDPEFWAFYAQATPIAHISRLPITSRPAMRSGGALTALDDLRAIPWVFAWVQSRYVVPGWYGVGTALAEFAGESPANAALLRRMYVEWAFFRTVIDNAQLELVRAHIPTAALYAALAKPARLRNKFHELLAAEHMASRDGILALTGQAELLDNSPMVQRTVAVRNPAILPLNRMQVALMDLWNTEKQAELGPESLWHESVLLSITGIAAGMQSTG